MNPELAIDQRQGRAKALAEATIAYCLEDIIENLLQDPTQGRYLFNLAAFAPDVRGLIVQGMETENWKVEYLKDSADMVVDLPSVPSLCPTFTADEIPASRVAPL